MKKTVFYGLLAAGLVIISCGKDDASISPVEIGFSGNILTLSEGIGSGTLDVNLGSAAPTGASFIITLGGDAIYGEDYTTEPDGSSGSFAVNVAKGDVVKSFTLNMIDDTILEANETITFTISSENAALELGTFTTLTTTVESNDDVLVIIERSTGKMYSVSPDDGSQTELMTIMYNGSALTGLKAFAYDKNSGKGFLGSSRQDNAHLYSVDMSTGVATLLNDNSGDATDGPARDGVADIKIDGNRIIAGTYHSGDQVIDWYSMVGAFDEHVIVTGPCCGGAIAYGGLSGEVYYGSEFGEIYKVNTTTGVGTAITLNAPNITPFSSDFAEFSVSSLNTQNFAESSDGNTYAIIYQGSGSLGSRINGEVQVHHFWLVTIDLATGTIEYVTEIANTKPGQKHGLGVVPDHVIL